MNIGYARVSTRDQNLELQLDALNKAGCETIFQEKASGATKARPELDRMLAGLRLGDTVYILGLTHGFAKRANAARKGPFSLATKVLSEPIRALLQFKCVSPTFINSTGWGAPLNTCSTWCRNWSFGAWAWFRSPMPSTPPRPRAGSCLTCSPPWPNLSGN